MEYDSTKICGVIEATVIARAAVKKGNTIPIEPCVSLNSIGKSVECDHLDKTGKTFCRYEGGVLHSNGGVECPGQRGMLRLVKTPIAEATVPYYLQPVEELASPIKYSDRLKKKRDRKRQVYF